MYEYIYGEFIMADVNYIILDNNSIGFKIYMANPFAFEEGKKYKIYLYENIREDEHTLFGFKTIDERNLFLKLINVKGLGPKMAMPILASGSIDGIIDAIERENILYLKKFPKIGDKVARQIILDLKGKLVSNTTTKEYVNDELNDALQALGYKSNDIKKVISNVSKDKSIEEQIKEALKLLLK